MKNFTALLLILVTLITISACKRGSGEVKERKKKITLKLLNYQDNYSSDPEIFAKIMEVFYNKYPHIKIEVENLYDNAFHSRIKSIETLNEMPDLVYMWPSGRSNTLVKNDLVEELSSYVKSIRANYNDVIFDRQFEGRGIYMLPLSQTATHVLYTNTRVLEKYNIQLPSTFEEFLTLAAAFEEEHKIPLVIIPNKDSWVMQACLFSTIVGRVAGADWIGLVQNGEASFKDQGFVDSLYILKKLYKARTFGRDHGENIDYGNAPDIFARGESPFYIDGDWRTFALVPLFNEEEQEQIEFNIIPPIAGQLSSSNATSAIAGTGFGMKKSLTSDKAKAAWNFISFMAGPEASKIRMEEKGIIPAYKMDSSEFELSPLVRKRFEFTHNYSSVPILDTVILSDTAERLNDGLKELAAGEITPEALAAELDEIFLNE